MGRTVRVEVVLLREGADGRPAYRVRRGLLPDAVTPDEAAWSLATGGDVVADGTVCHSTSWRVEGDDVVLTYAVLPDPQDDAASTELVEPAIVCSGQVARPTPDGLHAHHVAAHAVRHLADLARRDPGIRAATGAAPGLWAALASSAAGMPTAVHHDAHLLAGISRPGAGSVAGPGAPRGAAETAAAS